MFGGKQINGMTYNNGKVITKQRFILFLITFPLLALLAIGFWPGLVDLPFSTGGRVAMVALAAIIYLFFLFRPAILGYHYIYFSDDGNSIVFRFYSTGLTRGIPRSIVISKRNFTGYSLERNLFGSKPLLFLYENRKGREAKYPPICLSAIPRKKRERILNVLGGYAVEK